MACKSVTFLPLPKSILTRHCCRCTQAGAPLRAMLPRQLIVLLLAAWTASFCVAAAAQRDPAAVFPPCPVGWKLWLPRSQLHGGDPLDATTAWCVQPQTSRVAAAEAADVCARIFDVYPPDGWNGATRGLTPRTVSVHSEEQNVWLRDLLKPLFGEMGELVALGGAARLGDIVWWDGVNAANGAPSYTHFAPTVDWQTHSGCIAMRSDGFWHLVDCKTPRRAFVCTFPYSAAGDGNAGSGSGSNESGRGDATTTTSEVPAGDKPVSSPQPTRPPVPNPPPGCLTGWSSYAEKCYRLYTASINGEEGGMSQQAAQQFCGAIHPRITLTGILSGGEDAFLGRLVRDWTANHTDAWLQPRVFVGGIFISRGSVGVWYEDSLWYEETECALSFPSSPTWPTAANHLYSKWGKGEPSLPFGCVAVAADGTWSAVDCRASLPFVCAYLNDGAVTSEALTTAPESASASPADTDATITTTTSAPQPPEELCMDEWAYFSPTKRCLRVFTDHPVAAADLEQHCGQLFDDAAANTIHAAAITSVEESAFAGQLVIKAGLERVVVGVSYTERGVTGLYLDGMTVWEPSLAESLWAVGQPMRDSGCIAVGPAGAWYSFPCGTPARAYACAYQVGAVHLPVTSTPALIAALTSAKMWPLETRIASLSGVVHLVVAAGTVGTYAVAGAGGMTDRLLLMFAPDLSEVVARVGWSELAMVSPCGGGYKKQEYIFAVMQGVVTVTHPSETMRGRICVSDDGVNYVPAGNLTFEVVDVALRGFIPLSSPPFTKEAEEGRGNRSGVVGGGNESLLVSQVVGVRLGSSGALQLDLHRRLSGTGAWISHLRFSSSPDCTSGRYVLAGESCAVVEPEPGRSVVMYQLADVAPVRGVHLDRLHDPVTAEEEEALPTEFFVCVVASTQVPPPKLSHIGVSGRSTRPPHDHFYPAAAAAGPESDSDVGYGRGPGVNASSSLSTDGQPMWLYTLVPRLRVYVTFPHVSLRGMWALPPSGLASNSVFDLASLGPSAKMLVVPQFSSPVIVLDGEGLREGMALLLSRKLESCARQQPTSEHNPADARVPAALDTMLPVSTLSFSRQALDTGGVVGQTRVAFVQLNLNHTGLWGATPTDANQTWHLCFAYTLFSRFVPLAGLKITVTRARIVAATTHEGHDLDVNDDVDDSAAALPQLNIGVGFSGLIRLWGLNVHMWSPSTINAAEIAFAQSPPGNAKMADPALQCANTSLFYRQRSLGIVTPRSKVAAWTHRQQSWASVVVIPPGFLNEETTRCMRLCLSVPMPFQNDHRVFFPTTATVDIHPVEVLFIGPYAAHFPTAAADTHLTRVEVAENVNDMVLPLLGHGLREDMLLFLSERRCHPPVDEVRTRDDAGDAYVVDHISRMNFTILRPFDVPSNYRQWNATRSAAATTDFFITLNTTHTTALVADRVFGAAREPLFLCLYAPGTRRMVYPLGFTFVVQRPYVKSIRSISTPSPPQRGGTPVAVVYASVVDLVVEGFALHEGEAAFVPAVDCGNATSFLWRSPVRTSGVPSMVVNGDTVGCSSSTATTTAAVRYVNPLTSMSSWFLSLTQAHTARIGALEPKDNVVDSFQWCVRYRDADAATADATEWRRGFMPTGIPYRLIIPRTDGFRIGSSTVKRITRKKRHSTLGRWESLQLVGPLIAHTFAQGNPLFMFLAEDRVSCKKPKNHFLNINSSDRFITAVNGSAIILPELLAHTGSFKLCVSAIYPEQQSSEEGTEATLQFFELTGLRIELVEAVYAVFSLNRTDHVTVEQGQHWTLPISGSGLSNMSLVRFRPLGTDCSTPMPRGLDDVTVRNVFGGPMALAQRKSDGGGGESHYVVLEQSLIRGLAVQEHQLCLKPDRSTPWLSSDVKLSVRAHLRRPTHYAYFSADGSEDVVAVTALLPTKLALEWLTHEADTTNIVGAVAREVAVALWCRGGAARDAAAVVPCGSWRRIMFVRPLDDDRDPCFVDFEANQSATVLGPYVIDDSILVIPGAVSRNVSFYPNATQPWIMCLETAAERWREASHPRLQLQFTTAVPVWFRHFPDDASNTTATFFGAPRRDTNPPEDRTGLEGNQTLTLYMEDASKIFYLNGYGIQRGFMLRFGAHCEDDVAATQELNNTLLYKQPLTLEDDHGVFLLPSAHFARQEASTPMCLSTNGGASYARTNLFLTVFPSRLRRDLPADESRIAELVFRRTLVVPRMSKGAVRHAELRANDDDNTLNNLKHRTERGGVFGVGTRVLLSSACHESREGLPVIVVTTPGLLTLAEAHTRVATKRRLHICVDVARDEDGSGGGGGAAVAKKRKKMWGDRHFMHSDLRVFSFTC
ncbi:hypothetical protein TraAM80_08701 [Trypanosoma rangeli]|uniref:C-type lectin domain-containing protein n=1 Tax=Trypanosoma rangeli TaxID=5698 RepID=A0A3R7M9E0_TRYRA|nr:uncharacterized protein TraAM80_08701 [Trypanosoma rangeli]RNE98554.1 hypothetical protein TraAM80_08701 [Trypanosoma rangeli]|eukprot:RNE98554.1 hypothetical protein TraAM80_08701 [Trypanosoma rangeli]